MSISKFLRMVLLMRCHLFETIDYHCFNKLCLTELLVVFVLTVNNDPCNIAKSLKWSDNLITKILRLTMLFSFHLLSTDQLDN